MVENKPVAKIAVIKDSFAGSKIRVGEASGSEEEKKVSVNIDY